MAKRPGSCSRLEGNEGMHGILVLQRGDFHMQLSKSLRTLPGAGRGVFRGEQVGGEGVSVADICCPGNCESLDHGHSTGAQTSKTL